MKRVTKEVKEVEVTTILCDLCGGSEHMARYEANRTCRICEREVCAKCQGPYPEGEDMILTSNDTICVICQEMEPEYQPEIDETYRTRDELRKRWKENSLARTPHLNSTAEDQTNDQE